MNIEESFYIQIVLLLISFGFLLRLVVLNAGNDKKLKAAEKHNNNRD